MAFEKALALEELPAGSKKAVKIGETEILLIHADEGTLHAVEAKCPHAGAPLEQGAVCHGRLVCPWHMATFALNGDALPEGTLLEPPALRSLRHYAAKIEGDAIVVNPEGLNAPSLANYNDTAPAAPLGADRHFVTIGSGAAATAAVTALRQQGFAGRITMIDAVSSEPVDRTNLSKMTLAGKKPVDTLPLWKPEEKTKLNVERLDGRVDQLDGEAGTLHLSSGATLHFDAALLAPGGEPKRLEVPGSELPHVVSIRHVADAQKIEAVIGTPEASKGKRVVLIGDSFIAFEAASALTGRGLQATVVCQAEKPFSHKFGEQPAQAIVGLHQAKGVTLKLGAETTAITAEGVQLANGEMLPADLVIVAVGVEPSTAFAHGLPLAKDGGIAVSKTLQAASRLWVAGDAATVEGLRIEHWRLAQQHGRTAAAAMLQLAGAPLSEPKQNFAGVPFFWTAHFGKRFGYVGHATEWNEIAIDGSPEQADFLAFYVQAGAVKAVLGCGRDAAVAMLAESMRTSLSLEQARAAAARASA